MKHVHPWPELKKSGDSFETASPREDILDSFSRYREYSDDRFDIELINRPSSIKVRRK